MKPRTDEESENARKLPAKSPEIPMVPSNEWSNMGSTTASSALQTLNWGIVNRDTNALFKTLGLDPKARDAAERIFSTLPTSVREKYGTVDALLIDWRLSLSTPPESYRVLSQTDQGDEMTLQVQHQYVDGRVRENELQFYRDEAGGWRQMIPAGVLDKLPHVAGGLASPNTSQ